MEQQDNYQQPQVPGGQPPYNPGGQQQYGVGGGQQGLPNATAALILGILSILLCWLYGILGIACGIIGLVLSNKDLKLYKENPGVYTKSSYNNSNAGRICSIIGLSLSALWLIYVIVVVLILGSALWSFGSY